MKRSVLILVCIALFGCQGGVVPSASGPVGSSVDRDGNGVTDDREALIRGLARQALDACPGVPQDALFDWIVEDVEARVDGYSMTTVLGWNESACAEHFSYDPPSEVACGMCFNAITRMVYSIPMKRLVEPGDDSTGTAIRRADCR